MGQAQENAQAVSPGGEVVAPALERWLLGAMLLDSDFARVAAIRVGPLAFEDPQHRLIFSAICSVLAQGSDVDAVTLKDELRRQGVFAAAGGFEGLVRIMEAVPEARGLGAVMQALVALAEARLGIALRL